MALWTAYEIVSESEDELTVIIMARRKYIPPELDTYQEICIFLTQKLITTEVKQWNFLRNLFLGYQKKKS